MKEYIMKLSDTLLNEETGEVCFKVEPVKELIRCKDCVYWWKWNELCKHPKTTDGDVCCLECTADFYCSYAEKEE